MLTRRLTVVSSVSQSHPTLLATPWTVARQAPLSMARILEPVAISFSRGFFQPRDQTHVSCLAGRFFATEPPGKPTHRFIHVIRLHETKYTKEKKFKQLSTNILLL